MSIHTPSQVATQLCIEASTLRRWARFFATHLSPAAGLGNPRRYTDADLTMLQHAKQLFDTGCTVAEVQRLLDDTSVPPSEKQPTSNAEPPSTPSDDQTLVLNQHHPDLEALRNLAEDYQRVVRQQEQHITDQQVLIDQLQQEILRACNETKHTHIQASQARALAQQTEIEIGELKDREERIRSALETLLQGVHFATDRLTPWMLFTYAVVCFLFLVVFYQHTLGCVTIHYP